MEITNEFNTYDFILINETHIFEYETGLTIEDKLILDNIINLLKNGGMFLWGNAIPTQIWNLVIEYLETKNVELIENYDYTEGAIKARNLDKERVELYCDAIYRKLLCTKVPKLGKNFRNKTEIMLKNFYRHPGTNLYNTMVNRTDTYKHLVFQKNIFKIT